MNPASNGADAIVRTLADQGITLCFANPGTSEMHLLGALAREPRIRPVLCLFEGVATGAADGFARMSGVPAMTLLHLGPGYANGAANTHNARRAFSPMVHVVGDHATSHARADAPLASDIAALAATSSVAVLTTGPDGDPATAAANAVAASLAGAGGPVTLIVPADHAWSPARPSAAADTAVRPEPEQQEPLFEHAGAVARAIRSARAPLLLLGSPVTCNQTALAAAARLAAAGIVIRADTFLARQSRGGGRFEPERLPYFPEVAAAALADHDLLVLAATTIPVAFFAYPNGPTTLVSPAASVVSLFARGDDPASWLVALADALGCAVGAAPAGHGNGSLRPAVPSGPLDPASIGRSLARHMPADSIVSDDAVTSSGPVFAGTRNAARHDWLSLTGGAIGQGLPLAIGAAFACPGRRVVALTGDGAAMYTPQALWTMAREQLDIIVIVCANGAYRILDLEYTRTGAAANGPGVGAMHDLTNPSIDWCALAESMGVSARSCSSARTFDQMLEEALNRAGPSLIAARIQ